MKKTDDFCYFEIWKAKIEECQWYHLEILLQFKSNVDSLESVSIKNPY